MLKIPVKTVERVAVTSYLDEEVTKEVELHNIVNIYDKHFNDLIEWMLSLKFVASSCFHSNLRDFFSYNQGGRNTADVTTIKLIERYDNRYTFQVIWMLCNNKSIVILDEKPS